MHPTIWASAEKPAGRLRSHATAPPGPCGHVRNHPDNVSARWYCAAADGRAAVFRNFTCPGRSATVKANVSRRPPLVFRLATGKGPMMETPRRQVRHAPVVSIHPCISGHCCTTCRRGGDRMSILWASRTDAASLTLSLCAHRTRLHLSCNASYGATGRPQGGRGCIPGVARCSLWRL